MNNEFLNYALIFAYVAFNLDIIWQIRRVGREKDSIEISGWGVFARLLASTILLLRFIALNDVYLMIGQGIMALNLLVYLGMVIWYRKPRKFKGD